ncbi:cytochrome c551 [Jeotgalibacillus salarius]|uniref:Cytochrome c n=1 Tax=Jeotgalibacillus salarius TaxID=546023 RepID=A0A4Y8LLI0_9BACL|nr:cytochrome c [Jeotgalibacillus salarius]TFE03902.1 cytochrome c [Jeotgalibacillus salarius]
MKKWWLGVALGSAVLLGACGGGEEEATDTGSSAGEMDPEEIFIGNCSGCHGDNLEGASGPNLQEVGSRLSQDEILNVIQQGQGSMPAGLIEGEEAEVVAEWLSEMQ